MILFRFLVLAFNVGIITFLIFEIIRVAREPMERSRKILIVTGGILLLLVPVAMFMRFIPPTIHYFVIYPVGIALFIWLIRRA
jgi:hypothetical protein